MSRWVGRPRLVRLSGEGERTAVARLTLLLVLLLDNIEDAATLTCEAGGALGEFFVKNVLDIM